MDFTTLSRRELQALCKKNKIPANMTNIAMANALASLQQVEGLEEILNPPEPSAEQLMANDPPSVARTATRMSTRRKAQASSVQQKDKPPVQKVYSTRRSVRLLSKTMADLTLADQRSIQPIKMNELDTEISEKEVPENVEEIKDADNGFDALKPLAHGSEKIESDALPGQKKIEGLENEAELGDAAMENPVIGSSSDSSEHALSGSDIKGASPVECNVTVKAMDLIDDYVFVNKVEAPEENVSEAEIQVLAQGVHECNTTGSFSIAAEPILVDNMGSEKLEMPGSEIESDALPDQKQIWGLENEAEAGDTAVENPVTGSCCDASTGVEHALFGGSDIKNEEQGASPVECNVTVNAMDLHDECGGFLNNVEVLEGNVSEAEIQVLIQGVPESNAAESLSIAAEPISVEEKGFEKSEMQCSEFAVEEVVATDIAMNLIEIPVSPIVEREHESPMKFSPVVSEESAVTITEPVLPLVRAEPNAEEANKRGVNVDEDRMLKSLNDKSLRQLNKMLKEKLQIANKKTEDVSKEQQQPGCIRQALQPISDNLMRVGKREEN